MRTRRRAATLVLVMIAVLLAAIAVDLAAGPLGVAQALRGWLGDGFFGAFLFPAKPPEWKDRAQALVVLFGVPVGFLLWHWRDVNARDALENARKDINLKEFQEVQLRAAGALDEKLPAEAREQLQIASLHQLRGFLRGDYGESFRRPAFELLVAGHAAAMERVGHLKALDAFRATKPPPATIGEEIGKMLPAFKALLSAVDRERLGILRDEAAHIFGADLSEPAARQFPPDDGEEFELGHLPREDREELLAQFLLEGRGPGFPLSGRRFDWIELPGQTFTASRLLARCSFVGADLSGTYLEDADLSGAHLEDADLSEARLEGADLSGAHLARAKIWEARLSGAVLRGAYLEGALLQLAHLERAILEHAHLEGANLGGAHLEGAYLESAHLEGANLRSAYLQLPLYCRGATLSAATKFDKNWDALTESQREAYRRPWREGGAIFVDVPDPADAPLSGEAPGA